MSNERGVSEVLGAILVFALVLAVLVIIQVAGVPAANQQIEFEHNARVQADFQEFDQGVDRAAALGVESSSMVETGVRYPPRLFLINPGPAAGTVTTSDAQTVEFRNVKAVNSETNDFFNATRTYSTATLTYSPSYNEYNNAPDTHYEHGVLYNSDKGGAAVFANGNLVSGDRITLTMLDGSLSDSSTKAVTLQTAPISGPSQTVSVQGAKGNDLELEVYTDLSENTWKNRILANEFTGVGGHVVSVDCLSGAADDEPCNGQLLVTLESGVVYDVRLAKVGVGSGFAEEPAAYLTKPSVVDPEVNVGGTSIAVEVRDQLNNPVSGEQVTFTSPDGKFLRSDGTKVESISVTSDEKGLASAVFVPSASDKATANVTATAEFDGVSGTAEYEEVAFEGLSVDTTKETDLSEGDINPAGDGVLVQREATLSSGGSSSIAVDFENQAGEELRVVQARINFYSISGQSGSDVPVSTNMTSNVTTSVDTLKVAGDYVVLSEDITVADGDWVTLTFQDWKYVDSKGDVKAFDPKDKDFFVLTLYVSNDGDLTPDERAIYFIGARD